MSKPKITRIKAGETSTKVEEEQASITRKKVVLKDKKQEKQKAKEARKAEKVIVIRIIFHLSRISTKSPRISMSGWRSMSKISRSWTLSGKPITGRKPTLHGRSSWFSASWQRTIRRGSSILMKSTPASTCCAGSRRGCFIQFCSGKSQLHKSTGCTSN